MTKNNKLDDFRAVVQYLTTHQYEDGFKHVNDIDSFTDKIVAAAEMFLDLPSEISYNEA